MRKLISKKYIIFINLILFNSLFLINSANAYTFEKIISGTKGSETGQFGIIWEKMGKFVGPGRINVDKNGNIYISDGQELNNRVIKYNKNGTFLQVIGGIDIFQNELKHPSYITFGLDGNIYVLEGRWPKIYKFDSDCKYLSKFSLGIKNAGKIQIDKDDNLYVYDWGTNSVKKYSNAGEMILEIGGRNTEMGEVNSFALTNGGYLVLSLRGEENHLKSYQVGDDGKLVQVKEIFLKKDSAGETFGFQLIRIDDYGHIYIRFFDNETDETIVQRCNSTGNILSEYKFPEEAWPIEVDTKGNIYFGQCDKNEFRVMKVVE